MNRPENIDFILKDIKSNILDNYVCFLEKRIDKALKMVSNEKYLHIERLEKIKDILGDKENDN